MAEEALNRDEREQTAANTTGPLAGPAGESPENNHEVGNGAMQVRDVVVQACLNIMLLLGYSWHS